MSRPQFDISISRDGKVSIKVHGVSGKECTKLTDMLRDIVGKEEQRRLTSEYYGSPGEVRMDSQVHGHTHG